MRTVRLERTFDVVLVHDAIDYMTSLDDLRAALETVFVHCKRGGLALLVPDHLRETFQPSTEHGGEDGEGRSLRLLEWTYDPDPSDDRVTVDYVFVLREDGQPVRVVHDQHENGLFSQVDWLRLLSELGFVAKPVEDPFGRVLFLVHKP
ncbi:MAG: hypothetical protein HC915_09720 [Anaerolineae bacterium]|nr:hypothetical protein [Anaerolineae bacterium]